MSVPSPKKPIAPKSFYALTSPYNGIFWNGDGSVCGSILRFDSEEARNTYVNNSENCKAVRASAISREISRQGGAWVDWRDYAGDNEIPSGIDIFVER